MHARESARKPYRIAMPVLRIERAELYRRVWETPLRTLAREYGISDVALKKRCVKLKVPTPGLGYWAKRAAGKTPRRIPLPTASDTTPTFTEIVDRKATELVGRESMEPLELPNEGPVWEQEQFEGKPENRIVVPDVLDHPSRFIRATRAALTRKQAPTSEGRVSAWGEGTLNIIVTREQIDRAVRIMQAVLAACETRDFDVSLGETSEYDRRSSTLVKVHGETVPIRLMEQVRREERKQGKSNRPGEYEWSYPRYEWFGTGRLSLMIDERSASGYRKSWTDGKTQRVEDCLNDFMVGLVEATVVKRAERTERAERERQRAEERERERVAALAEDRENRRRKQLETDADYWTRARGIREFANAAEETARVRASDGLIPTVIVDWLAWARAVADEIDPLKALSLDVHVLQELPSPHAWPTRA